MTTATQAPEAKSPQSKPYSFGVVEALGRMPPGSLVTEEALARMLGRHHLSVRRAMQRGELPPSVRLNGARCWTAGSILRHIEARLDAAAREAERRARRIEDARP